MHIGSRTVRFGTWNETLIVWWKYSKEEKKANYAKHALREKNLHISQPHTRIVQLFDVFQWMVALSALSLRFVEHHYAELSDLVPEMKDQSYAVNIPRKEWREKNLHISHPHARIAQLFDVFQWMVALSARSLSFVEHHYAGRQCSKIP
uniref:Transposase n=1 Tax=Bursaphelenchus xylophilus TaxID=6326 RepID=A0A1I7RV06_BURXY